MTHIVKLNPTLRNHFLMATNRNLARRLLKRMDGGFLWRVYCNGVQITENDLRYAVGSVIYTNGLNGPCYRVVTVDEISRVCIAELVTREG